MGVKTVSAMHQILPYMTPCELTVEGMLILLFYQEVLSALWWTMDNCAPLFFP